MGLRFSGAKKSMMQCLRYLQNTADKGGHKNYCLKQVAQAINQISGNHAEYYAGASKQRIKNALKSGHMVLFEERDPIHTAVLLYDGDKIVRFSNGSHKTVTLNQIMSKRSTDGYYKGCAAIRR